jgi:lauroyl/myristoyl acyltransferase
MHSGSRTALPRRVPVVLPDGGIVVPRPRMPPAPLGVRLKTSPLLRRLVPTPRVVARAEAKGRRLWREHEPTRANALRTMAAVVAGTDREGDLQELAERYVVESLALEALLWQPWRMPRVQPATRSLLERLRHRDRGLIFSACHWGPYYASSTVLFQFGYLAYAVAGDWYFEDPSHDRWGRRLANWRRQAVGVPLFRAKGSFAQLAGVLGRGGEVLIYYDMPGRHATDFLGKRVMLVDGTARLAAETGALIAPIRRVREGPHQRFEVAQPLDPLELGDVDAIHDELARFHEAWILEDPAAMADPAEFGWEDGATTTGWSRPSKTGSVTQR